MVTKNNSPKLEPFLSGRPEIGKLITSNVWFGVICVFGLFLLTGCGTGLGVVTTKSTQPYYKPAPPIAATDTPEPAASELERPAATPVCIDNLTFLSDASIPDGTEVEPDATLDKRWEVKNSGNCNWDEHYRLRLIAGPAMDAVQEQALYPARSQGQIVLQIIFRAPTEPGNYRSAWQAYNPAGQPFGDPVFIDIVVK